MKGYDRPRVLSTYSVDELAREAAACAVYNMEPSDRELKEQIEPIEGALGGIGSIRTR
jgi:hypothetical protein